MLPPVHLDHLVARSINILKQRYGLSKRCRGGQRCSEKNESAAVSIFSHAATYLRLTSEKVLSARSFCS